MAAIVMPREAAVVPIRPEPPVTNLEDALNADDVARLFKVGRRTVYEWAASGALPSVRIGRTVRFRRVDIAALLAPEK